MRPRFIDVLYATFLAVLANCGGGATKAVDGGSDVPGFTPDCDALPNGADSGCQAPDGNLSASRLRYPFGCAALLPVEGTPHTCTCGPGVADASTWAWACGV